MERLNKENEISTKEKIEQEIKEEIHKKKNLI